MRVEFYSPSRGQVNGQKFWIDNNGEIILEKESGEYALSSTEDLVEFKAIRYVICKKANNFYNGFSFYFHPTVNKWYLASNKVHGSKPFNSREARDIWLAAYKLNKFSHPLAYPEFSPYQ